MMTDYQKMSAGDLAAAFVDVVLATDDLVLAPVAGCENRRAEFEKLRAQKLPVLKEILRQGPDFAKKIGDSTLLAWVASRGWADGTNVAAQALRQSHELSWLNKKILFHEAFDCARGDHSVTTRDMLEKQEDKLGLQKAEYSSTGLALEKLVVMLAHTEPHQQAGSRHLIELYLDDQADLAMPIGGVTALEWAAMQGLGDFACQLVDAILRDKRLPFPARVELVKKAAPAAAEAGYLELASFLKYEIPLLVSNARTAILNGATYRALSDLRLQRGVDQNLHVAFLVKESAPAPT